MIDYLTLDDALEIIEQMGVGPLRDMGLLASALIRPQMTVFGDDAYPTLAHKAAALMHSLARNHLLVDGNERLARVLSRTFLRLNHCDLRMTVDDAEAMMSKVAAGDLEADQIAAVVVEHLVATSGD